MSDTTTTTKSGYRWIGKRPIRHDGVDKVTGRAQYGADFALPGMLYGRALRSTCAHARIKSIDTSAARALEGVKDVITAADFPEVSAAGQIDAEAPASIKDTAHNVIARDKVRYHGHAVAAVAAVSPAIADAALKLIKVDYEPLPVVLDVMEACAADAPLIDESQRTNGEADAAPSNVASSNTFEGGDLTQGFDAADVIIEHEFDSGTVHQGYIETHACMARATESGEITLWVSSQGHFSIRDSAAQVLAIEPSKIRAIPAEIGGGFGGKTTVYLEPMAILMAQRTGHPVKMVMTRDEVFRATGPAPGSHTRIRMGATRDGRITAVDCDLWFEAGGFPGSAVGAAMMALISPYDVANFRIVGYDVLVNKPKSHAYRAPGAPNAAHASECVIDEICEQINMDPLEFRLKNAAKKGTKAPYGPVFPEIGMVETVQACLDHPHYRAPLGPNQGRGVASGFWMNGGGDATAHIAVQPDGMVTLVTGRPDIGGSRAGHAMVLAEELGIDVDNVRPSIGDTDAIGFNGVTGGSSTAYSAAVAVHEAAQKLIADARRRAAEIWDVQSDDVEWRDGAAHLKAGVNGTEAPLTLADLADKASQTGGPLAADASVNAKGAAPALGTHICDVEVDPETGKVDVIRYTVAQDAGRAIHKSYVEGQLQGGAVQGIGWALNEEYLFNEDGVMENAGFLDYRMPVALDLPMIDTVVVEVPNPRHPYGVRGVGENAIVQPLAAVANAIYDAVGVRLYSVPMSPPRVLKALHDAQATRHVAASATAPPPRNGNRSRSPRAETAQQDPSTIGRRPQGVPPQAPAARSS